MKTISKKLRHRIKRLFLILVLLPLIPILPYDKLNCINTLYYIIPTTGLSTYIILFNFPCIVERYHSRPLYYNDLEHNVSIDPVMKKRFQIIFVFILQIILTLLMSGLVYYYFDQFHTTGLSNMEIFGVIGGFISIMLKIENIIGKCILILVNIYKDRSVTVKSSNSLQIKTHIDSEV